MSKKAPPLLAGLLLAGIVIALGGCGRSASAQPGAGGQPDSARIEIDDHRDGQNKPVVTLTVASVVQQLYATIYALPTLPEQRACTDELGPHYTLTFGEGNQTLVTVRALREGCKPVTITGETRDRQGTAAFWTQLDRAIYQGTPPAKPDLLAIAHTPDPAQAPETAQVTSAETAQRLYDAILALPLVPNQAPCQAPGVPAYQLVFHTTQRAIPAVIDNTCKTIALDGAYQARGGVYTLNDQFNRLFAEIVAGATFAPAQPDHLTLTIQNTSTTSQQTIVANTAFMRQLYHKVFALPSTTPQPDCPSGADKVAGKGTWYSFAFSQWSLPILQIQVYEGSCIYIAGPVTGQVLHGDQEFWDLVHQAATQQ